jgi:hypothetical protein
MDLPNEEDRKNLYRHFYTVTSNKGIEMCICIVCARELMGTEGQMRQISSLRAVRELLMPVESHRAHRLHDGMLLVVEYLRDESGDLSGWICVECMQSLKARRRPRLSLANNMWIGGIPDQLKILSIPEQLLIALHHPRCFVFKLFPKDPDHDHRPDHLQRGMSGNVSLYHLNVDSIAEMVGGHMMPHPGAVLASVLAITFIGSRKLPKEWLKSTFRVRRRLVYEALLWLKDNNPLYGDIDISKERLMTLPEDGIPDEVMKWTKVKTNQWMQTVGVICQ